MPRGVYARKPRTGAIIRAAVTCRACVWAWKPSTGMMVEPCPQCGKKKDVRQRHGPANRLGGLRAWRARRSGLSTESSRRVRSLALRLVGKGDVRCVRCGCDSPQFLEINHKDGGGTAERRAQPGHAFYRAITSLRRSTDDLELLCRPCNAVHSLELVHGPLPFRVVWGPE